MTGPIRPRETYIAKPSLSSLLRQTKRVRYYSLRGGNPALIVAAPRKEDIRAILKLAVPVITVQLGLMLMGVVDTMVVGRVSAVALAAVALGNLTTMTVSSFGMGVLFALDPLVSQAMGAGDRASVRRSVQRGMLIGMILCIPTGLILLPGEFVLPLLQQPSEVIPVAASYARIRILGLPPFFAFIVLRQTLQAMRNLRPIVQTTILANIINLVADYALVFGWGPIPAMGPLGSAWATTGIRWIVLFGLLVVARHDLAPLLWPLDPGSWKKRPLWNTFRLGLPIGVQIQLEFLVFGVVALLMGRLGPVAMAAHQVAINLASLTFMVPVGFSAAASVLIGQAIGERDPATLRRRVSAALLCGTAFMSMTAVLFLSIPGPLAALYSNVDGVLSLALLLIPIAGVFQIFDGIQVVSAGILRGMGDTRAPMLVNIAGFWLCGLPVSLHLAFVRDYGPQGLWWGLVVGLGAVAFFLVLRIISRLKGELVRVQVE